MSPPVGPHLVSAVGDIGGWAHTHLSTAPSTIHVPIFGTVSDIDYAGSQPTHFVRIGEAAGQIAISTDSAATWTLYANAPYSFSGGHVAYSAQGISIVWTTSGGSYVAKYGGSFVAVSGLPTGAIVKSDKSNDAYVSVLVWSCFNGILHLTSMYEYVSSTRHSTGNYTYPQMGGPLLLSRTRLDHRIGPMGCQ